MTADGDLYSVAARLDVLDILRATAQTFGPRQRDLYAALIDRAVTMLAGKPTRAGSRTRPDLGDGVRSFHVALAARRRKAAAHVVFYRTNPSDSSVLILRVLHEQMDPERHLKPDYG